MKYKIQIDDVVRDATAEEAALIEAQQAEAEAEAEAEAVKQVAREELLTRLGITEAEAQLLLGA
jgi:hypothetical protein